MSFSVSSVSMSQPYKTNKQTAVQTFSGSRNSSNNTINETNNKVSFAGFLWWGKPKAKNEDNAPKIMSVAELNKLIKANKINVDELSKYTPESLAALPEKQKAAIRYCSGIVIDDQGNVYKEPSNSWYGR